jgi:hypothetical protein
MFSLPVENWRRLIIWLGIGLAVYFFYGRKHSTLAGGGGVTAFRRASEPPMFCLEWTRSRSFVIRVESRHVHER